MKKDYYKILGLEKSASDDDIKRAYRKLAHQHHPDRPSGDEGKFKEINEAYQVLSNRDKKRQYDQFGQTFDGSQGNPFGGFDFNFDFATADDFNNLGDVFDTFFEGLGVKRRRTYHRGSDLEINFDISLEEAFRGLKKKLSFPAHGICSTCKGHGHFADEGFTSCSTCDGRGEIRETRSTFFGNFAQVKRCAKCFGSGQIPNKVCDICKGNGRVKESKEVEVDIAPGVRSGQIIKVAGAGEAGERGALSGDLYIRVRVKDHSDFIVKGEDIFTEKEINILDALEGKQLFIKTLSGEQLKIELPKGANVNDLIIVPNEGMPRFGAKQRGNLFVKLNIKTPKKLSAKAKKLIEDLRKEF